MTSDPTTPPARVTPIQADREALKPCPFCGGKAVVFGPYGWYQRYGISHNCPTFYNGGSEAFKEFPSARYAADAWNTRAALSEREQAVREAGSYIEWQQRRGRAVDLIDWAIAEFDGWMLDDHYDARVPLDTIVERFRRFREEEKGAPHLRPKAEDHPVAGEDEPLDRAIVACLESEAPHLTREFRLMVAQRFGQLMDAAALARPAPDALAEGLHVFVERVQQHINSYGGSDGLPFLREAVDKARSLLATEGR